MSSSAARLFADLSVGKKLMCGFGLVLLLTVAVTCSGFLAVQAVLKAHASASGLSAIDALVLQARRAERDFALRQNSEAATQVHAQLERVGTAVAQQLASTPGANQARLKSMQQAIDDYRRQFDGFVAQQNNARAARTQMHEAAFTCMTRCVSCAWKATSCVAATH
jgi:methyl-accepting chemotaxis protein